MIALVSSNRRGDDYHVSHASIHARRNSKVYLCSARRGLILCGPKRPLTEPALSKHLLFRMRSILRRKSVRFYGPLNDVSRIRTINEAQNWSAPFKSQRLHDRSSFISRFSFVQSTIRAWFPSEIAIAKRIAPLTRLCKQIGSHLRYILPTIRSWISLRLDRMPTLIFLRDWVILSNQI